MRLMVNFGKGLTITTSWDDGHPMDLRVAELLTRYGLPGTFYVPLSNSRPTLSTAEIRGLSQQFEIGAHTVNHVRLTALADSEAQEQVTDSKKQLEDILGKPCSIFCFPGGSYSKIHFRMLREAGFVGARTVKLLSLERPCAIDEIAVIPTTIQAYPHTAVACSLELVRDNFSGLPQCNSAAVDVVEASRCRKRTSTTVFVVALSASRRPLAPTTATRICRCPNGAFRAPPGGSPGWPKR